MLLRPTLSREEAEAKFKGRYLSHDDYDLRPTESVWGKFKDGSTAFIYLVDAIPEYTFNVTHNTLHVLKFNDVKNSRRAGLRQSKGGELVLGHMNFPEPREVSQTAKQNNEYWCMVPLIQWLGATVCAYLPEYHEQQREIALKQPDHTIWLDINFKRPDPKMLKYWLTKHPQAFPIFSTMTINKSTLFRSHADAKNEGGLACLTAFGKWAGGEFCLPRLRVAFPMTPGSILIADNNNEQHGNIGPLVGNRISVVAYLRAMKKKAAPKAKATSAGKS